MLAARLQRELTQLTSAPPPGVAAWPADGASLQRLAAQLDGPRGTVYEGGVFALDVRIPDRYPFEPPQVRFVTPVYHPNIDAGGRICLDILNLRPKGAWTPSLNVGTVLQSIGLLLAEPNPDDGLMSDIASEFKHARSLFDDKARRSTQQHACGTLAAQAGQSGEGASGAAPPVQPEAAPAADTGAAGGAAPAPKRAAEEAAEGGAGGVLPAADADAAAPPPRKRLQLSRPPPPA